MSKEIRRSRTGDPEMDAINVITQALEPLDRHACERVLKWAKERYVEIHLPGLALKDMGKANEFMQGVAVTASRLNMNGADLLAQLGNLANRLPADDEHIPS
jgi:hypothetical protein